MGQKFFLSLIMSAVICLNLSQSSFAQDAPTVPSVPLSDAQQPLSDAQIQKKIKAKKSIKGNHPLRKKGIKGKKKYKKGIKKFKKIKKHQTTN